MSPQRLDALCLEACYPPGIPMDGRSGAHIKATVRKAVLQSLEEVVRRMDEDGPGAQAYVWIVTEFRDELTAEPPK